MTTIGMRMPKIASLFNAGTMSLLMFSIIMGLNGLGRQMTAEVEAFQKPKVLTSSSLLMKAPRKLIHHHHRRFRRDTYVEGTDDDENYEIIPTFDANGERPKSPGEHISERAEKIAQTFSNMWQSMVDTAKHLAEAIRQLFTDDEEEYHLTPEELQARGYAIEEQNEIWRRENQL